MNPIDFPKEVEDRLKLFKNFLEKIGEKSITPLCTLARNKPQWEYEENEQALKLKLHLLLLYCISKKKFYSHLSRIVQMKDYFEAHQLQKKEKTAFLC